MFGTVWPNHQPPFYHCESLVHDFNIRLFFPQKTFLSDLTQIYPEYDIDQKEFGKKPS